MSMIEKIASALPSRSPKLARAGRYAVDHPEAIALQSMRGVATEIGVAAPTMQRLALHLGYETYEHFRKAFQDELLATGFGKRASALRTPPVEAKGAASCSRSERPRTRTSPKRSGGCDEELLHRVAHRLCEAEKTCVIGSEAVHALADVMVKSGDIVLPGLRLAQGGQPRQLSRRSPMSASATRSS